MSTSFWVEKNKMNVIRSLIVLLSSLFLFGCDSTVEFEKEYPYAFLCDGSSIEVSCRQTANPATQYPPQEKNALLVSMETMQNSFAQVGRLRDAIDIVFSHFSLGSPIRIKITNDQIPVLGGVRSAKIHSEITDFSKVVDNVNENLKDFKTYQMKETIKNVKFVYSLSIPKDPNKYDFAVFLLMDSNAIVLYSTSPEGDQHFKQFFSQILEKK